MVRKFEDVSYNVRNISIKEFCVKCSNTFVNHSVSLRCNKKIARANLFRRLTELLLRSLIREFLRG